jgi:hypothetical protein
MLIYPSFQPPPVIGSSTGEGALNSTVPYPSLPSPNPRPQIMTDWGTPEIMFPEGSGKLPAPLLGLP